MLQSQQYMPDIYLKYQKIIFILENIFLFYVK